MPYKAKGKCVYRKDTGKKVGCTKGSVKKYLAALHANVKDIKESEEFDWVKDILQIKGLGFDDLKVGDIVRLKGYDSNQQAVLGYQPNWEVVDIYMSSSYMTGRPSEKRIKFKRTKGNSYGNSYLELWKSPLNSEDYFELVKPGAILNRKIFESEEFDWVKDSISDFESSPAFGYYQEIKDLLQGTDYNIEIEESRTSTSKVFKIYDLYGDIVDAWGEKHFRPEIIEEDLKSQLRHSELTTYSETIDILCKTLEPFFEKYNLNESINESEEWYSEVLSERPLLRFNDLMVGDIISNISPYHLDKTKSDLTNEYKYFYYHVLSFEDGKTWRNAYEEPEKYVICNLVKKDPDTGNFIPVSRTDLKFPRGTNEPIWTLIYRENVIESENWYEDVIKDDIILKVEDLEMNDIVIPTCVKEGEYIVSGRGTSVKLLHEPTHWVTLKRNTTTNTGGIFIEHDSEIGRNCRFKLVHRQDVIEESEEDDFGWAEDVINIHVPINTNDFKTGQIFVIDRGDDQPYRVEILQTNVKDFDADSNQRTDTIRMKSFNDFTKRKLGDEFLVRPDYIVNKIINGEWRLINNIKESEEDDFGWIEDNTKYLRLGQKFRIRSIVPGGSETYAKIVKIDKKRYWVSPLSMTGFRGRPIGEEVLLKHITNGDWTPFDNMNESEDDFGWAKETLSNSDYLFQYRGKEVMIDIRGLNNKQIKDVLNIIKPYLAEPLESPEGYDYMVNDNGEEVGWNNGCLEKENWSSTQSISLHCGVADNDYKPLKGAVCCVSGTYENEPSYSKENIIPVDGKQLLGLNSTLDLWGDISESEEEGELFWAEDLLKSTEQDVDITGKLEVFEKLPKGAILKIWGYQDDLEMEAMEAKVIQNTAVGRDLYQYLFKVPEVYYSDDGEPTHCGHTDEHRKICDCVDDNDAPEGEYGKCWWIDLSKMEKVTYYPNRFDLFEPTVKEGKTQKPLLTEGRYDAITRKVVRDIMKAVTEGDSNSYNLPWDISFEHDYEQEGLTFNLELDVVHSDDVNTFEVRTAIADDDDENVILMTIILGPKFNSQYLEKLFYKLQEDIRHEIEHLTQIGPNRIEDRPTYKGDTAKLKTVYGHHKNIIEVPALVHGFYRRAKLEKKPLDEIMTDDLDSEIEKGLLTKNQAKKLLDIWLDYAKKNLPKAKYSF